MEKKHILLIGEKETFLVRVLVGKSQDTWMDCSFVHWDVNSINAAWDGINLVVMYMDESERPSEEVMHFLKDKLGENGTPLIPIGERADVAYFCDNFPEDLIYKAFVRPVNNDEYVSTLKELFKKIDSGDFKKSILIVDDDPNYLGLVREWLKDKYKVSMANSGLQAIKWLGKNKADLILLDYEMPVTTGPQVLEMLRSEEETKNIPVMFLTGKGDKDSVMEVLSLKPEGYFLKSIEMKELLDQLENFFTLHR